MKKRDFPSAEALRAAGYIPVPRLWVRPEDVAELKRVAEKYADDVNRIRGEARAKSREIESAWSSRRLGE